MKIKIKDNFSTLSPRPVQGARINDGRCKSLIREERENDTFHFP